jgi:hypothetical protein
VNLTITPLIRIAALVGLIGIVALGGIVLMTGRSHTPTPSTAERHGTAPASARIVHVAPKTHAATASPGPAKTKTAAKTATAATHPKAATPATHKAVTQHKTATKHKSVTKHTTVAKHKAASHKATKFHGNPVYADLPQPLQWQLAHHKVVVVSFYNPNAEVDAISVAEAHAGAVAAGAGFLLVSVLNDKVAGILTALLPGGGMLPQPGVLIYKAPGDIAVRMDGFADRDSVSQAASNAAVMTIAPIPAPAAAAPAPAATTPGVIVTP